MILDLIGGVFVFDEFLKDKKTYITNNLLDNNGNPSSVKKKKFMVEPIKEYLLSISPDVNTSLYIILNDLSGPNKCKVCSKELIIKRLNLGFPGWCSVTCKNKDPDIRLSIGKKNSENKNARMKKRVETTMGKYGVSHISQVPSIHKRQVENNMKRFKDGTHGSLKKESSDKRISTLLEKYSVTNSYFVNGDKTSNFENDICSFLDSLEVGYVRNSRNLLYGNDGSNTTFEIDIYIPILKIGIECNGSYWHSESAPGNSLEFSKMRHSIKQKIASNNGIHLIQIFDSNYYNNIKKYNDMIKNVVQKNSCRIGARNCSVVLLQKEEASIFLEEHHLQGSSKTSSKFYGLKHNDKLVSVSAFRRCPKNINIYGDNAWELTRFATIGVNGGLSKIIKRFMIEINPETIYSFADLLLSNPHNNVYLKSGFNFHHRTKPDYFYFDPRKKTSVHKFNLRKSCFARTGIDVSGKTEYDLAQEYKFYRVWDAGKICYSTSNMSPLKVS